MQLFDCLLHFSLPDAWQSLGMCWGQHAVPVWLGMLALVCVLAWWWAGRLQSWTKQGLPYRSAPAQFWTPAQVACMLLAGLCFAWLAWQLHHPGRMAVLETALAQQLGQSVPAGQLDFFSGLSHLSGTRTLTVACVAGALVLSAFGQRGLAAGWVLAIAGNALLNSGWKALLARVRPEHLPLADAEGWSFPSGHSSGAMAAWGMLVWIMWQLFPQCPVVARRWVVALAAGIVFSVGYSRVALQAHYVSDVLAGWLSGGVWLMLCAGLVRTWRRLQAAAAA